MVRMSRVYFLLTLTVFAAAQREERLFDVDRDNKNECYEDGDNFQNDPGNTDRGDWGKCLPVTTYTVLPVYESETLYERLSALHTNMCTHIDFVRTTAADDAIRAFLLSVDTAEYTPEEEAFLDSYRTAVFGAVDYVENIESYTSLDAYGDVESYGSPLPIYMITDGWTFGPTTSLPAANIQCQNGMNENKKAGRKKYSLMKFGLNYNGAGFEITEVTIRTEPTTFRYDLSSFKLCPSNGGASGGVCVWWLNDVSGLPPNQQNGFNNTAFVNGLEFPVMRPDDPSSVFINETYQDAYTHCHYSPTADGIHRVYTFQHELERLYLPMHQLHRQCFCDWKLLGTPVRRSAEGTPSLITDCDCTRDSSRNGNCNNNHKKNLLKFTGVQCNGGCPA